MAELRATLGFRELRQWEAFYEAEPWGALRDNMHAGLIAATMANQNRKRGTRAATFKDFLLIPQREQFASNREKFRRILKANAKGRTGNG